MPQTRLAHPDDGGFLRTHDSHLPAEELAAVIGRGRVLLVVGPETPEMPETSETPVPLGWLRWGLFWDQVPFMNMLQVLPDHRGTGLGRLLVEGWEAHARAAGHGMVLTSTMSDEQSQHFYRHLGYRDTGVLELPGEAPEILLRKDLD